MITQSVYEQMSALPTDEPLEVKADREVDVVEIGGVAAATPMQIRK